jgi:hypothetical protein
MVFWCLSIILTEKRRRRKKKQIRKNEECRLFSEEEYENEVCVDIYIINLLDE